MAGTAERKCIECGERITGRADKKFCSDECRIDYNNRQNSGGTKLIRNTDHKLHKNRRILAALNPGGKTKVHRSRLSEKGFNFELHTSTYRTREGALYTFCYEHGYLDVGKDVFLLVVRKTLND